MTTERERKVAPIQAELAAEAHQRRIITEELKRVKERLLAKSSSINFDASAEQWQIFSTYFRGIPDGITLDENNLLDVIGYCVFLLAEQRAAATADHIAIVAAKSPQATLHKKRAQRKRAQRMPVRERTPFKNKRLPKARV